MIAVWTRETAIAYLNDTLHTLRQQRDLSPANPLVTDTLNRLVRTLGEWHRQGFGVELLDEPVLAEARARLPELCAVAETHLEKWWCRKALASDAPARVLADFWYLRNYRSLCRAETALTGARTLGQAIFLGCGALPLTAILLASADEQACLRCVEADAEACALAAQLVRALAIDERITLQQGLAERINVPAGATVICASLLKAPGLYQHLAKCGAARLLIRDVEGVYRWLYRPAELPGPAFRLCGRTRSAPARINITHYYEAADDPAVLGAGLPAP